jgi:integrase
MNRAPDVINLRRRQLLGLRKRASTVAAEVQERWVAKVNAAALHGDSSWPRVIESCRDEDRGLVFVHEGDGYTNINNSGWQEARRRAAERYEKEFGRPCPDGFRNIRVHDLKHTYGYRLRAAGVQFEDRQLLLGHKAQHVTTHDSAADIGNLIAASEKACELASRKSPAVAIVRARGSASA